MENRIEYVKDRVISGVVCESSGEYLLPDYNGDVKKILHVGACVMPSGKFLDGDTVEFTGTVTYDAVYLDSENNIDRFSFSTDYEMAVKCSEERFADADIDITQDNFNLRPIGPRKISAKSQLSGAVHVMERDAVCYEGDGFTEGEPELLVKEVRVRTSYFDRGRENEYREEIVSLDGVIADEVEVLYTGCEVKIDGRELTGEGACHKGEIKIYALIKVGDGIPEKREKSVAFEDSFFISGELPGEPYPPETCILSSVCVKSIGAFVEATEDGASVVVSLVTEGKMRVGTNTPVMLAKDSFLTECMTENETCELSYSELVGCCEKSEKLSFELDGGAVGFEGGDFLLCSAKARVSSVEILETGAKLVGDIRFSGIACKVSEDNTASYSNVKVDLPFEQKVNIGCQVPSGAKAEYEVFARGAEIYSEGAGLNLTAVLDASLTLVRDRRESYVAASYRTDTHYESDPSLVTVYYPEEGETLYEVSKKFHKSPLSVASVNALTESAFADKTAPLSSLGIKKIVIR